MKDFDEVTEVLKDFRDRMEIDKFKLDENLRDQATLYREIGECYTSMNSEAKRLKDRVEFVRSSLMYQIRQKPDVYKLTKTTESAVQEACTIQPAYQEILAEYTDTDEVAKNLGVLLSAAEHRRSALKDLTSLFSFQYYSTSELTSEIKKVSETSREELIAQRKQNKTE